MSSASRSRAVPPTCGTQPLVRQSTWSLDALRASEEQPPGPRALSAALRAALHDSLWHSLSSEYDARHLSAFLRDSGLALSAAFWAMERAWALDENKHYCALRWLYSRVYGVSECDVAAQLEQRQPDFTALRPLLADEFSLCVVLAFDELASARSYARDRRRFRGFGPVAVRLFQCAARDEFLHCRNALDLVRTFHADRRHDVASVLAAVIAHDVSPQFRYGATFLLDQIIAPQENEIDEAWLRDCANKVQMYLNLKYGASCC